MFVTGLFASVKANENIEKAQVAETETERVVEQISEKFLRFEDDTDRTEKFFSLVYKYTDVQEHTPAIVYEFFDKVSTQNRKKDGDYVQEIELF